MSGFIEKAKLKAEEVLHKNNNKHADNPHSTNQGPHSSNAANAADPRVDSDRDGSHNLGSGHNTGVGHNTGYGSSTTGYGSSNTGYGSTTAGPHDSNLANKADPRVDSDRDGRSGFGQSGHTGHSSGIAPTHHATTGSNTGYGQHDSTNAGPHSSNLANKLDPRVDSDRDNRNDPTSRVGGYGGQDNYGQTGYGQTGVGHSGVGQSGVGQTGYGDSGLGHSSGVGHSGVGHNTGAGYGNTGNYGSSNAGPHDSNLANKLDPRVDSDRDNRNDPTSRVGGYGGQDNYGQTGYGQTGTTGVGHSGVGHSGAGGYGSSGTGVGHTQGGYGQTSSGLGHDQGYGSSATPGSGTADKTAGPHNSNLLNKLDPRVDSDVDGSKTVGGNQTRY